MPGGRSGTMSNPAPRSGELSSCPGAASGAVLNFGECDESMRSLRGTLAILASLRFHCATRRLARVSLGANEFASESKDTHC